VCTCSIQRGHLENGKLTLHHYDVIVDYIILTYSFHLSKLNNDVLMEVFSYLPVRDRIRLERGKCVTCWSVVSYYITIDNSIVTVKVNLL